MCDLFQNFHFYIQVFATWLSCTSVWFLELFCLHICDVKRCTFNLYNFFQLFLLLFFSFSSSTVFTLYLSQFLHYPIVLELFHHFIVIFSNNIPYRFWICLFWLILCITIIYWDVCLCTTCVHRNDRGQASASAVVLSSCLLPNVC